MKKIPNAVLLACGLCAVCVILGGVLRFATEELRWAPLSLAMVGVFVVGRETFRWGASRGYVVHQQALGLQIERVGRCLVMTVILVSVSWLAAGIVLQVLYELFWR